MKALLYLLFRVIGPSDRSVVGSRATFQADATRDRIGSPASLAVVHPPLSPRKWRLGADTAGFGSGVRSRATPVLRWEPVRASPVASVQAWGAHTNCCVSGSTLCIHKWTLLFRFRCGGLLCAHDSATVPLQSPCLSNNAVNGGLWAFLGVFAFWGVGAQARRAACRGARRGPCGGGLWLGPQRAAGDAILRSLPVWSAGLLPVRVVELGVLGGARRAFRRAGPTGRLWADHFDYPGPWRRLWRGERLVVGGEM